MIYQLQQKQRYGLWFVLLFSAFAPEIMRILADEKYYEAVW